MPSLQDFATISQSMQGQQQSRQEAKQKMQQEIFTTMIKEKIKGQMQAEKIKAVMAAWQNGGMEGKKSIIDANGKWTVEPVKAGEEFKKKPISPFKNLPGFLSGVEESPGFKTPQDITGEQFQQDVGRYTGAGREMQTTPRGGIPISFLQAMGKGPAKDYLKSRLATRAGARGVRQQLGPQFAGRPISQDIKGQFKVGEPYQAKAMGEAQVKGFRPRGYRESLQDAVQDIQDGKDPMIVFRAISSIYPQYSPELKRILLPSAKLGELDISEQLWGR